MKSETILKAWEELKDKVEEMSFANFAYRQSFVISGRFEPERHSNINNIIKDLGIPDSMVVNSSEIKTYFPRKIDKNLTYNLSDGSMWSAGSMVILTWGPTIKVVD